MEEGTGGINILLHSALLLPRIILRPTPTEGTLTGTALYLGQDAKKMRMLTSRPDPIQSRQGVAAQRSWGVLRDAVREAEQCPCATAP